MSVKKINRTISKAEYINTAYKIYSYIYTVYSALSKDLKKFTGTQMAENAEHLIGRVVEIESIFVKGASVCELQYRELLVRDAIGAVKTIDTNITSIYNILLENNGQQEAERHLPSDNIMKELGECLGQEVRLLQGVLKQNKEELKLATSGGFGKGKRQIEEDNYIFVPLVLNVMRMKNELYALQNNLLYDEESGHFIKP